MRNSLSLKALLVVTRITVSSASVLPLASDSSVSALTLDSRVAAGQDAGTIASMFVLREELAGAMLEVLITSSSLLAACPPHDLFSTSTLTCHVALQAGSVDALARRDLPSSQSFWMQSASLTEGWLMSSLEVVSTGAA